MAQESSSGLKIQNCHKSPPNSAQIWLNMASISVKITDLVRLLAVLDHKPLSKTPNSAQIPPNLSRNSPEFQPKSPDRGALDIAAGLLTNVTN